MRRYLSLVGAMLLLLAVAGCQPAKVRLAYAASEGMKFKYKVVSNIETEIVGSGTVPMKIHSEVIMTQQVERVDKGTMTIEITYDDGFIKILDKRLPHPLNGESYIVEMNKQGKILHISGLGDIESEVLGGIDLRKIFQEVQVQFPNKLVEPGDKWAFSKRIKLKGEKAAIVKGTFLFKKYENIKGYNCARIEGRFFSPFSAEFSGSQLSGKVTGKESGKIIIHFTPDEGKLIKSSVKMKVNSVIEKNIAWEEASTELVRQRLNIDMDTVLVE